MTQDRLHLGPVRNCGRWRAACLSLRRIAVSAPLGGRLITGRASEHPLAVLIAADRAITAFDAATGTRLSPEEVEAMAPGVLTAFGAGAAWSGPGDSTPGADMLS